MFIVVNQYSADEDDIIINTDEIRYIKRLYGLPNCSHVILKNGDSIGCYGTLSDFGKALEAKESVDDKRFEFYTAELEIYRIFTDSPLSKVCQSIEDWWNINKNLFDNDEVTNLVRRSCEFYTNRAMSLIAKEESKNV